jgi:hypothetical protein
MQRTQDLTAAATSDSSSPNLATISCYWRLRSRGKLPLPAPMAKGDVAPVIYSGLGIGWRRNWKCPCIRSRDPRPWCPSPGWRRWQVRPTHKRLRKACVWVGWIVGLPWQSPNAPARQKLGCADHGNGPHVGILA